MRERLRDHGLLIANLALFVIFFGGMILSGVRVYNSDQLEHGQQAVSLGGYLLSGDFLEATFENWESEFLQMGMYVVLTAFLFQRGSSESKPIDEPAPQDEDPREAADRPGAPWPVRRGGWVLRLYEHSLSHLLPSVLCLVRRARDRRRRGVQRRGAGARRPGRDDVAVPRHVAVLVRVVPELAERVSGRGRDRRGSVYLRQRGSPESKPVAEPHRETGA